MCGRYTLFTRQAVLEERFDATAEAPMEPRYNCSPGQQLPVITGDAPDTIQTLKWGLVPSWAERDLGGNTLINARAETVREKRSFAEAYEQRRCLVLADGFYEWVSRGETKQPYRVAFADDRPFAMAGLWERWTPPQKQTGLAEFGGGATPSTDPNLVETFTVITTEPNDLISTLHHRMAVVLDENEEETWLTGDADEVETLLDPYPDDEMEAYPVSTQVNSPANDGPQLIEEVESSA